MAGNMESMLDHRIYRDTMCHSEITPIIKQLCGETYRLDHLNIHTHIAAGFQGGGLHGSHHPGGGAGFYELNQVHAWRMGMLARTNSAQRSSELIFPLSVSQGSAR